MGKLLVAKEIGAVNLDGKRICAAFVGVLVFMSTTTDSRPACQPGRYFDIVVGRCTPCTDICLNAAIQGTGRQCQQKCPNFKFSGNVKVESDPEDHKPVAVAILGTLIGTIIIVVVGSGILIWKRNKDFRDAICRRVCRNRNFEQVGDRDETEPKELLVCGNPDGIPEPDNGNSGNSGDGTNIENIEFSSMVPPTENNFAQVTDTNCSTYTPTF